MDNKFKKNTFYAKEHILIPGIIPVLIKKNQNVNYILQKTEISSSIMLNFKLRYIFLRTNLIKRVSWFMV